MARFRMKQGVGSHSMRIKGKFVTLKSGDVVDCERHEIGDGAMFKFDYIDARGVVSPEVPSPQDSTPPENVFKKIHKGKGRYLVVREDTNEPVHEDYLTKDAADALIAEYNMPPVDGEEDEDDE